MGCNLRGDDGIADGGNNVDEGRRNTQCNALGFGKPVVDQQRDGDVHEEAAENAGNNTVNGPLPESRESGRPDIGQAPYTGDDSQDNIGPSIFVEHTAGDGGKHGRDNGIDGHEERDLLHVPAHIL